MSKFEALKTLIQYGNLSQSEVEQLQKFVAGLTINEPTRIALGVLKETNNVNFVDGEDVRDFVNNHYQGRLVDDLVTSWAYEQIDWNYIFRKLKENVE